MLRLRLDYLLDLNRYAVFYGILARYMGVGKLRHGCAVTYTRARAGTGMYICAQHAGVLPHSTPTSFSGQTPFVPAAMLYGVYIE